MNLAVISDLHLGTGTSTDEFGHDDGDFLRFLTFLERNFERIVLLGDIWETLTGTMPETQKLELDRARAAHPEIARRFRGPKYHFVHGNHDLVTASVEGAPEEYLLTTPDVRILFTHGHQQDHLFQQRRRLSEWAVWFGGWIRRVGLWPLYQVFQKLDELRSGASYDAERCSVQRWAMGVAEARELDIVVTGHTHLATRAHHGPKLYLNGGSCSNGQFSYLSMDTRALRFEVHEGF